MDYEKNKSKKQTDFASIPEYKDVEERLRKHRERVFKEATEVYEKLVSEQSALEMSKRKDL